jgi:metallo-beta-lactamase class B
MFLDFRSELGSRRTGEHVNRRHARVLAGSLALYAFAMLPGILHAQQNAEHRSWNQPVEPFRIAGNVYYVGASDITSFLITDSRGHIIIDAGFVETVPQILSNIRKLGFDPRDVRVLVNTQAHYDHAAGFADLKRLTRARLLASEEDAKLLESGGRNDFAWGDEFAFPPVDVDGIVKHADTVRVGNTELVANITPGHTKGCTTWTLRTMHNGNPLDFLFHCSSSVPGYDLIGNPKYPDIVADYRKSFDILDKLACDVPLSAHGRTFGLTEKSKRLRAGDTDAFIDPNGCRTLVRGARTAFEAELQRQKGRGQ